MIGNNRILDANSNALDGVVQQEIKPFFSNEEVLALDLHELNSRYGFNLNYPDNAKQIVLTSIKETPLLKNDSKPMLLLPEQTTFMKSEFQIYMNELVQKRMFKWMNENKEALESTVKSMEEAVSKKEGLKFWKEFEWFRLISNQYNEIHAFLYQTNSSSMTTQSIEGLCRRKENALINAYCKGIA